MKVEVMSRQFIKPSSPTPHHLRAFNLSFLDQLAPPIYIPILLFYESLSSLSSSRCDLLKESLSETLTRYYTFAGRIRDDCFIVDCNDAGVHYLEARVHSSRPLSQVIHSSDINQLKQFLPFETCGSESDSRVENDEFDSKVLLAVQVNLFDCGGIVIGVCLSHKMGDASSLTAFINDWAAITREAPSEQIKGPRYHDLSSLFPQRDNLVGYETKSKIKREGIVTKKFVFEAPKIAELKEKSMAGCSNNRNFDFESDNSVVQGYPSRVEAVSAFIWNRFIDLDRTKEEDASRVYACSNSINMRTRIVPPLPNNSIGNMYCVAIALSVANDNANYDNQDKGKDHYYSFLVAKVRGAVREIDGDRVRQFQTTDALLQYLKPIEEGVLSGQIRLLTFSSWCRFPIYEADFGWGKPIWVSTTTFPFKNVVVLMDTRTGDGIEAWVNMTEEDMSEFERDDELLAIIS